MRDGKKKTASADNPLLTQYRETIKQMQEACAPLIVLAKGRRPPKLQVKPESSKSASSQSGSAFTASKWFWESSQQASGSTYGRACVLQSGPTKWTRGTGRALGRHLWPRCQFWGGTATHPLARGPHPMP